jgi:drug/metabolite transporter (DMT)-like permease
VTFLSLLSSVVATIAGYLFLHQAFTLLQLIGALLTLVSVIMGQQLVQQAVVSRKKVLAIEANKMGSADI